MTTSSQTSSTKSQKMLAATPILAAWLLGLMIAFSLSGCNALKVETNAETPPQPQTNVCADSYSPLAFDLALPARPVSFDTVLARGDLKMKRADFFAEFAYFGDAPIRLHTTSGEAASQLTKVCENPSLSGLYVAGLDYYAPLELSRDYSGNETSVAYKYTLNTESGDLAVQAVEDARLGRVMSAESIIRYNMMWRDYRLYEVGPDQYELRLQTIENSGNDRHVTRMVIQYQFTARP